jgi:hypothetical protein
MDIISGITGLLGGLFGGTDTSSNIDIEELKAQDEKDNKRDSFQTIGVFIAIGLGIFALVKAIKK